MYNPNDFKDSIPADMNRELTKFSTQFKPIDGVEYKQYDKYGFDKDDELSKFIAWEGDNDGFEYIPPSEE